MNNLAYKDGDDNFNKILELLELLIEAEEQVDYPDAEFAAKCFRELLRRQLVR